MPDLGISIHVLHMTNLQESWLRARLNALVQVLKEAPGVEVVVVTDEMEPEVKDEQQN